MIAIFSASGSYKTLDMDAIMEGQNLMPSGAGNTLGAANLLGRSAMPTIASPRFYVYVLARPNGKPFYVGKGKGRRVYDHEWQARRGYRSKKCNTIRKIWREGGQVQKYIVLETSNEQEALDYERDLIALYGRESLCNISEGGQGPNGYRHPPELVARIAAKNTGKTRPLSARLATSVFKKQHWQDPTYRARMKDVSKQLGDALRGVKKGPRSAEERANISAGVRAGMTEQVRVGMRERAIKRYQDPSERARQQEAGTERWKDPEYRERMKAAARDRWARHRASKARDE